MEDFVSFEIAKKLKEKGFTLSKNEIIGKFDSDGLFHSQLYCNYCETMDSEEEVISPTISQVLKWLRKEKKIHVEIDIMKAYPEAKLMYWGYNIVLIDKYEVYHFEWNSNSFEQAAFDGIEYILDNLL